MKAFVIGIDDIPESVEYANRCINSFVDVNVEFFSAVTPRNTDLQAESKVRKLNLSGFTERWSRKENAIACFLSHHSLWMKCYYENTELLILEHDAPSIGEIPKNLQYDKLISIGKPSYGRFTVPRNIGVNPLTSKQFLPGAHAYMLKPEGAKALIQQAKVYSEPTDVFLQLKRFPWLQEYYPWVAEVRDTFSTVQKEEGCNAKHNYTEQYRLL